MVKQLINVDDYWRVLVYYNVTSTLLNHIKRDVKDESLPVGKIDYFLSSFIKSAKAITINIPAKRTSIVLFKPHKTVEDYISSIVHEAEHVKDGILEYYNIPNIGEAPAYTIGYLVRVMFRVFKLLL